jgi:hypothetical protein
MSALDDLAPDQRAVLQMVLRGRSYDEIARLLSIERSAVRQRALDGFDALTPASVLPGPERALVTDYLLGQLPERVAEQVHSFLLASEVDREWAQALAAVVAPLTSAALPEIPVGAPLGADPGPTGGLERNSDPPDPVAVPDVPDRQAEDQPERTMTPAEAIADEAADWPQDAWSEQTRPARSSTPARTPREPRPSSRRGGAILLGVVAVVIVAVVLIVVLGSGGGTKKPAAQHKGTGIASTTTQTQSSTVTTSTTGTTGTTATDQPLVQLNLTSPTGAKSTLGVVQVERVDGVIGMVIYAQGIPANTAHNAYAVWLYNSTTSFKFVGFVQYLVGKTHTIDTEGKLPAGATKYHHLLITLETQAHPSTPGEVVLSGPFREHS